MLEWKRDRMTEEQLREALLQIIGRLAPEGDLKNLRPDQRFRDQFDFDSVDFLNFALALQERFNIVIPEEDFPALSTLSGCQRYLMPKLRSDAEPQT